MTFQPLKYKISWNPRRLFLIDGLGAVLSAFMLGVVLIELESVLGIPAPTLYFLAVLPVASAFFDLYCFLKVKAHAGILLKSIAYINVSYSCISLALALYHHKKITGLGWTYILLEIFIILTLATIEFKTARLKK